MTVEVGRPGTGWRKGKKKGDLLVRNQCITKVAYSENIKFINETGMELPEGQRGIERYVENRSSVQGSPRM